MLRYVANNETQTTGRPLRHKKWLDQIKNATVDFKADEDRRKEQNFIRAIPRGLGCGK